VVKRLSNTVFVGSLGWVLALAACGGSDVAQPEGGEDAPMAGEAPPSPEAVAAANALTSRLANSDITLIPTHRGTAKVSYTRPTTRRRSNFMVTTFRIRNEAANAIAGFQVDEFWFDDNGNTVTGDRVRFREPILAGQVVDIELRVPRHAAMSRSNYEFAHQNGDIDTDLVEELPDPEVEEEEEGEGEGAETPDP
jgi:hypothetical protein